jgi:hypothetical protein
MGGEDQDYWKETHSMVGIERQNPSSAPWWEVEPKPTQFIRPQSGVPWHRSGNV